MREAKSFYTDLAASSYSGPVEYIENWLGPGRTTYGSDFPFIREKTTVRELGFLDNWIRKNGEEGEAVMRRTALDLFPRLKDQIKQAETNKREALIGTSSTECDLSITIGEQNV